MTHYTLLTNRKNMNTLYEGEGILTDAQYNAYLDAESELLNSLGLLDNSESIKCVETDFNGNAVNTIETTRYDALDGFIIKDCIEFAHNDDANVWGLYRTDDRHFLWFIA